MSAMELGEFDHVVAMDSLIHYDVADGIRVLADLADRVRGSMVFTTHRAPCCWSSCTPSGKLFPRGDRSPAIQPVQPTRLQKLMAAEPQLRDWHTARTQRVSRGFYISQACELRRP
jgi:magnesium-protoporphyrin O-methyltransferase